MPATPITTSVAGQAENLSRSVAATPHALTRLKAATRDAIPALVSYLALRLVGVGILAAFADRSPRALLALLGERFDSTWYVRIAEHGYPGAPITAHPSDLAFFPLYPALIAAADPLVPGRPWTAALALAWLSGLVAAWGLFALGRHLRDTRTGVTLAALWAVLPHALVESMAYTEGLFTALAAWALYTVLRRRWLTAGTLALLAGTCRPTAAALVAAVVGAAAAAAFTRRDGWRPWVAGLLAPAGLIGYLAFVAARTRRWDGYSEMQRTGWRLSFDGGRYTVTTIGDLLDRPTTLSIYVTAAVLVVATVLLILLVVERWPAPLLIYATMVLIMTVGAAGYFYSKGRLLLPDFPLLLPTAVALAGARPARVAAALVPLALLSGWFGAYLSLVWRHSP